MAKSDFNVEENNDFTNQSINNKKAFFGNNSNSFNEPEIVYDENSDKGPLGQISYFLTTINRSVLIFFGIIIAAIIVGIIVVVAIVSSYNKSFKTEITIPDVVYLGETSAITAISSGTGNVSNTTVTFENEVFVEENTPEDEPTPELALELVNKKMTGKKLYNTMIPIEEGGVTIKVNARSGSHKMGSQEKTVYVCPKFNSSLVTNGIISIEQGGELKDLINFGPGACSSKIKYKSSNPDIFTVDKEGKITGIKTGIANLIVTRENKLFSVPVHVSASSITMSSFSVTPKKIQLNPGENRRLNVSYLPTNATTQSFKFSSANSDIAEIDEYGKITGVHEGTTQISINSVDVIEQEVIEVVVSKEISKTGSTVTDLILDNQVIDMTQGESLKLNYIVVPDEAMNKTVTFKSSDNTIATVNKKGVVFAKKGGNVSISASTNNYVTKIAEVRIKSIAEPTVLADDGIIQNNWHNKDYKLKLSGGGDGATYYYGYNKDDLNKTGTEISLKEEGSKLVYTKACIYNICGPTSLTLSKLDSVKPKIIKIITRDDKTTDDKIIYIAAEDRNSKISKWCINNRDNVRDCNWIDISPIINPVISKRIKEYGQYYVYVRDEAGNVSDAKIVTIDGNTESNNNSPLDY